MKKNLNKIKIKVIAFVLAFSTTIAIVPTTQIFARTSQELKLAEETNNFKVVEQRYIESIDTVVNFLVHNKTGTQLVYMENDDTEKTFGIGFRTYAENNKGINHIIEHSVINGSKNYPVHSPFVSAMSSSMATFINALTFSDFTIYPVASRNEKDYTNLMKIYLDGVFSPNVLENENIFMQEGVRLEVKDEKLNFNGTVYNEMLGNASDPYRTMMQYSSESLFPDTQYKYNSGGNPKDIQDLTYEELIATYKKNYHPSNAMIFLYGKQNINNTLAIIDGYLSQFEMGTSLKGTAVNQKPLTETAEINGQYSVTKDSVENKNYLSYNFALSKSNNYSELLKQNILINILVMNDSAPLRKAIKQLNVCDDVNVYYDQLAEQSSFGIVLDGVNLAKKDLIIKTIDDTIKNIYENGIDEELLEVIKNSFEYSEVANVKNTSNFGINLAIKTMSSYMYGKNAVDFYGKESDLQILDKVNINTIKEYTKKYLIDNKHRSIVIMSPKIGGMEEFEFDTNKKLENIKNKLSNEEFSNLKIKSEEFSKWQSTPDSPEQLATLPKLKISDLAKAPVLPKYSVEKIDDVEFIYNDINTNEISSIVYSFDAGNLPQDKIQYARLYSSLVGSYLDTDNYSKDKVQVLTGKYMGNISANLNPGISYLDTNIYNPRFNFNITALDPKLSDAVGLAEEIILNSNINNKEAIRQNLQITKNQLEQNIPMIGSIYSAYGELNDSYKYLEYIEGYSYYLFIEDLLNNFDTKWETITSELNFVKENIFVKNNLKISYTGSAKTYEEFKNNSATLVNKLQTKDSKKQVYEFEESKNPIAYSSSSLNNQFVYMVGNLGFNKEDLGKFNTITNIINFNYLWTTVRDKGGAYGVSFSMPSEKDYLISSYRDPNLLKTLEAFKNIPTFLREVSMDQKTLNSSIISFVSQQDEKLNHYNLFNYGLYERLGEMNLSDELITRESALKTTPEDLLKFADILDKGIKNGKIAVSGSRKVIDENKGIFKKIVEVK